MSGPGSRCRGRRHAAALHPERRVEHVRALHRKRRVVRRDEIGEGRDEDEAAEDDDRDHRRLAHHLDDRPERASAAARARAACRRDGCHRHPYLASRIRGSMKAYRMSTTRLIPTIMKPAMITTPCTSGKSRWKMPS